MQLKSLVFLIAVLALGQFLAGCGSRSSSTAQTLQQVVAGTFDRSADERARLPDRLRRETVWVTHPPVKAREVRVTYDIDQRTVSWRLDVQGSGLSWEKLAGVTSGQQLGVLNDVSVLRVTGGPFDGALALSGDGVVSLVSQPYALRYEPSLLNLKRP